MPTTVNKRPHLERMYEYRRKLPHYQKADRALFVTFRKLLIDLGTQRE